MWDDTLAAAAQTWANKCEFRHSQGEVGPYGENLSATTGYASTIGDGIGFWEDEAPDYDRNNPIYSHFTQMVWRSTTKLGCAEALCPPGSIFDGKYGNERFYVCEYSPPGNAGNAAVSLLSASPLTSTRSLTFAIAFCRAFLFLRTTVRLLLLFSPWTKSLTRCFVALQAPTSTSKASYIAFSLGIQLRARTSQ